MSLIEYSKLSVSGYCFHFRSSSPAIFWFCEVANGHRIILRLQGCRLHAEATLVPLPAASRRVGSTATGYQHSNTSISFTY